LFVFGLTATPSGLRPAVIGVNNLFVELSITETMWDSQLGGSIPGVTYVLFVSGLTARANPVAFGSGPRLIVAMTLGPALAAIAVGSNAARSSSDAARTTDLIGDFGLFIM
jgi:hypothetical protein